jgi:hypothetical protein
VIDPSAVVTADYRMRQVVLADGRTLSGVVVARSADRLSLRTPTETHDLAAADVEQVIDSGVSIMPSGQLGQLSEREVRDLIAYLRRNPERTDLAVLVIVGGWLQGGRCVTHVIDKNYTEDVSNVLREQRLVDLIRENLEKVAPVYLREPVVAQIIRELPDIREKVNVGLKEPVKHENVKWLHLKFDELVTLVMTPDPPPVEPKEPAPTDAANQVGPGESARPSAAAPSAPPTTAPTDISTPKPDVRKSMVPAPLPGGNAPYRSAVIQTAPRRSYWPLAGGALGIAIIAFFVLRWKVGRRAA